MTDSTNGTVPPAFRAYIDPAKNGYTGTGTAFLYLLPYIEADNVFRQSFAPFGPPYGTLPSYTVVKDIVIKTFLAPADESATQQYLSGTSDALSSYAGNMKVFAHPTAISLNAPRSLKDIKDGTTNTILLAEKRAICAAGYNIWVLMENSDRGPSFGLSNNASAETNLPPEIQPNDTNCSPGRPSGFYSNGNSQVSLCDGSVRTVLSSISTKTWQAALTPANREVLDIDW